MNNKLADFFHANRHGLIPLTLFCGLAINPSSSFAFLVGEPVSACVIPQKMELTDSTRQKIAQCLGWQSTPLQGLCEGTYVPIHIPPPADADEVKLLADNVSLYQTKPSTLSGHVNIQQGERIVTSNTAYIYRDSKTNKITHMKFVGNVHYYEPDRLLIAEQALINPEDKSGYVTNALYRLNVQRGLTKLPAYGRAQSIKRFANKDYLLKYASYSTCAPLDKAWDVEAKSIAIDDAKEEGVARNAVVRIRRVPVLYAPYLSFPTSKKRKSGFLIPAIGYSNIGGFNFGTPYYWNMAPNYDMTITPSLYTRRGIMLSDDFRYLTQTSTGRLQLSFLPQDKAFKSFLDNNVVQFPFLQGMSTNRWAVGALDTTNITSKLQLHVNAQQVSDDYYLQDFNTNLAQVTQTQLLRQADAVYTQQNWTLSAMVQSYQTLHPVNEPPVSSIYERLPQLVAKGYYDELPYHSNFNMVAQYDQFHWPQSHFNPIDNPQGPRFHVMPNYSIPLRKPWGFVTPSVGLVNNYYQVGTWNTSQEYGVSIPRMSVDSGLYFDRFYSFKGMTYQQTLEPRLFYLYVPYKGQSAIPIYDSGMLTFTTDQLFRMNRFSGVDRIGDANQLSYALTTHWYSANTGTERAMFSLGQIKYFADRKVQLCQPLLGTCNNLEDVFGYLSPTSPYSPVASRGIYHINSVWRALGDYVWDPATKSTNNADINIHYNPYPNAILSFGYSYLINADITAVRSNIGQDNALHQAVVAYTWPFSEKWSTLGAYSQNISKNYSMMSLLGVQYDSCCWAMRVLGGRTFRSLNASYEPQYSNNVYVQLVLKGLGSVATSDPNNVLNTYIPGYHDPFRG